MASRQTIGKTVSQYRKVLGLTQKHLSEITGIHKVTMSEIENGRFTGSFDILERLLDAVGLKFDMTPKRHELPDWDEIDSLFAEDD
ncbi:helix-turn-helix transcriptional regulator [Shewanella sp. 4t3-1-2LB]|jgi:transcriptional regulator with XRE-family HTH domain|uniref:helix-turn-helix domain-containing protein n=1 Tax=Shewanella sp. 4t3-1-2LB TaxID=2817682 RepID=UPI001A9A1D76|nr:helix-turn-helix transcriptional regulator [Shewanella sp. 4t3-1-2LB]MBO1273259.1 helix-turn-helix transcriptional regulator [Shewanella sp. 4t3-1-2LB]